MSVDSKFSHLAWIKTPRKAGGLGDINAPVLSDLTKEISRSYDVLLEDAGVALRGTVIIDGNGTVRNHSAYDLPVGRNVDETLRCIEGLQFADEHGEVSCRLRP